MDYSLLLSNAFLARNSSYSPYSNYAVGAAVLTEDNKIFTGANIENASYGATICAERTAIYKAVLEGYKTIKAIAIVGGNKEEKDSALTDYAYPCGICRQVMREFGNPDELIVIVAKSLEEYKVYKLKDLLPDSFGPEHL